MEEMDRYGKNNKVHPDPQSGAPVMLRTPSVTSHVQPPQLNGIYIERARTFSANTLSGLPSPRQRTKRETCGYSSSRARISAH